MGVSCCFCWFRQRLRPTESSVQGWSAAFEGAYRYAPEPRQADVGAMFSILFNENKALEERYYFTSTFRFGGIE